MRNNGLLAEALSSEFIALRNALAVEDTGTAKHALASTLQLSRRFALSAYDTAYLQLALRHGSPLATLDSNLHNAAVSTGLDGL